jgi:PPOX class probable F420-dependent enzyme
MKILQAVQAFLAKPNMLVLSTLKKDGSVQMSVVWYEFVDGKFKISTTIDRAKYFNIKRDARVSLLVPNAENIYQYVQANGTAEMSRQGAPEFIDKLSNKYRGVDYPENDEQKKKRITITITLEKIRTIGFK